MTESSGTTRRSLVASGVGNALEWYDWAIYAILTPYLAAAFFADGDPTSALLATLAVFAVGFAFRPLGGAVFGWLADRWGRRRVMITTMLLMASGSLVIGLLPSYGSIGLWASLFLVLTRLLQGFAHGGEYTASYAYVAEIAPPARRGLWSSTLYVTVGLGTLLATLVSLLLTTVLTADQVGAWGWRIPFLLGAGLAVFALRLRQGMVESVEITGPDGADTGAATAAAEPAPTPAEAAADRARFRRYLAQVLLFGASLGVVYYTWVTYASTLAIAQHGMAPQAAFRASLAAQVIGILCLPLAGALSDRIGRKRSMYLWGAGFAILQFPLVAAISGSPLSLFVTQSIALAILALATSINPCIVSEVLPQRYRTRTIGIAGSVAASAFGGTAPFLNAWLTSLHLGWVFNVYIVVLVGVTMLVVRAWPETRGIDLRPVAVATRPGVPS